MATATAAGNPGKFKDIRGLKFHRLTAIERRGSNSCGHAMWLCRCDCGKEVVVAGAMLRNNKVHSCGCYNAEATSKRMTTHGMSDHPLYEPFKSMWARVESPHYEGSENYGGRGITVCPEWEDIHVFIADMMPTWEPNKGLSLDRIDVNGNYCKENCRWATQTEQNNNKRNNHRLEFNGKNLTIAQWAKETGLSAQCIWQRIHTAGLSNAEALTRPVQKYTKTGDWVGKTAEKVARAKARSDEKEAV